MKPRLLTQSDQERNGTGTPISSGSSLVGYLREHYKDCQISGGATKPLLALRRRRFSRTYDSLSSESGSVGVVRGTVIPFHAL